jgi:hypothetical protein
MLFLVAAFPIVYHKFHKGIFHLFLKTIVLVLVCHVFVHLFLQLNLMSRSLLDVFYVHFFMLFPSVRNKKSTCLFPFFLYDQS